MTELHDLTALEQARAIRTREISAVELTEHYLRRADARADELGVFLARTDDLARSQAAAADARVAAADPTRTSARCSARSSRPRASTSSPG